MSVFIIAEAGVNHNGSFELACKLADAAKIAGVDCIKFQTFRSENLVSHNTQKADYQKVTTGKGTQRDMLKKLELSFEEFIALKGYCDRIGIRFLSTPFDFESIEFLNVIDMPFWKIPSGEITNYPYLVEIAKTGKDIILSTGMSTLQEVDNALAVLRENGAGRITLLHCTTSYPTPMQDVNLNAMITLRDHCGCPVGYSDHTQGIEVPIAAAAMGAEVIEKHFTLSRNMEGPDHKASLEPEELKAMVSAIRNIEKALGSWEKIPSESEKGNLAVARKSIMAAKQIKAGDMFTEENLTTKRPGTGIDPMRWKEILGKRATRDFEEDELVEV